MVTGRREMGLLVGDYGDSGLVTVKRGGENKWEREGDYLLNSTRRKRKRGRWGSSKREEKQEEEGRGGGQPASGAVDGGGCNFAVRGLGKIERKKRDAKRGRKADGAMAHYCGGRAAVVRTD